MKTRFSTLDICAVLAEINEKAVGMRLANVYDINNKTYLFKLAKPDLKILLLVESGIRMHLSEFEWPKNTMPSGFSFKLRKHLRGRRLVSATQLGIDRIIDLQFGSNEAAYHVIVELYDRGNIALTDCDYVILNLLRFRKDLLVKADSKDKDSQDNDDVKIAVHEPYPVHAARPVEDFITIERLTDVLENAKKDSLVKRVLNPVLPYGAPCLDHCLLKAGFSPNCKIGLDFVVETDVGKLHTCLKEAEEFMQTARSNQSKGFLIKKKEKKSDGELLTNVDFQPFLFEQHKTQPYQEYESFNKAVDEFFGSLESQKQDLKALQFERSALKKLDNIRKDHESRISGLQKEQEEDKIKAALIEANLDVVDQAIRIVCSAIANQVDWSEIKALVHAAQMKGDPVASLIKSLKLETNTMIMLLSEPSYSESDDSDYLDSSDDEQEAVTKDKPIPRKVELDLSLSAYSNAQRYYNMKRQAMKKEQRTVDASTKAFKSAEKKTKQTLKEAAAVQNIQKARKVFWFEKFLWFVSSENFLVIGGRDAQQNELLVKKYLNSGDVYVHADLHGATSCIIKNPTGTTIPPKTLNEAGTMAICHSAAWDAKVVTSAWWVSHDQVTKTAPSGEYLTTGSFLIRGKKNYLPPSYLVYGFGFLFKVDETCIWKHKGERKVRSVEDDLSTLTDDIDVEIDLEEEAQGEDDIKSEKTTSKDNSENEEDHAASITNAGSSEANNPVDEKNYAKELLANCEETNAVDSTSSAAEDKAGMGTEEKARPFEYPDTVVRVQYDTSDKYQLDSYKDEISEESGKFVYLGDDTPVPVATEKTSQDQSKPKLSAKQRREQRKQKKAQNAENNEEEERIQERHKQGAKRDNASEKQVAQEPETAKRGKKNKLKKIKEKYKDQDEEERQFRMEILQSANAPRNKDKKKKGKQEQAKPRGQKPQQLNSRAPSGGKTVPQEHAGITQTKEVPAHTEQQKGDGDESDEEKEAVLKEENLPLYPVEDILDSLTGSPAPDDVLLFAIPVCAPYISMQNYKFKVKLTPGSGKKGKAAKTAISMFMATRETTQQEKDHLRSVKDHDLSRGMPGKVKVSAPNLQKQKHKGKR